MKAISVEIIFGILGLLFIVVLFSLPLLIAEKWIEKQSLKGSRFNSINNRDKNLSLYQKIQRILNQSNNRTLVVNRLKILLFENGYKLSKEEDDFIQLILHPN